MRATVNILLLSLVILAVCLGFFYLAQNPPALDWDEAALGYNAYSLIMTGKDEYSVSLPLAFQSFGDYKPPLYIYLSIVPVWLFGLNEFSVRFPSALVGTLSVLGVFYLTKYIFSQTFEEQSNNRLALLAGFFFAISPWHLQFSRAAFEANAALFFVIFGITFLLKAFRNAKWTILACIFLVASMYTYHSTRLVVPALVVGIGWYFRRQILTSQRWLAVSLVASIFLLLPLIVSFVRGTEIGARLSAVSGLTRSEQLEEAREFRESDLGNGRILEMTFHDRRVLSLVNFLSAYLDHFNPNFLFLTGDVYFRHNASRMGLLYYFEILLVPIGFILLFRSKNRPARFMVLWWFAVAPIAAALTKGTPHAIRSLLYLPTFQILSAIGLLWLWKIKVNLMSSVWRVGLLFIIVLNIFYYLDVYYIHTPYEVSQSWQYGYKDVVRFLAQRENQVSHIIVTNKYDQPYIYFLFYRMVNPSDYQQETLGQEPSQTLRKFGKYEFRKINWDKDDALRDVIIVGSGGDPPEIPPTAGAIVNEVNFLDGSVAFRIVQR